MANVPSPADALALFARSMKLCAKVPAQHDAVREAGALLPLVALLRSSTFGGAAAEEARVDALEALCDLTVCSAINMRAVRDELAEALVPLLGHAPLAPELLCILARSGRRGQELIREAHGVQPLVQLLAQLTDAGAGGSASTAAGAPSSAAAGAVAGAGGPAAAGAPLSSAAGAAFISAAAVAAAADSPQPLMLPTLRQDRSADEAALLPRVLRAVAALAAGDAANQAELREAGVIPLLVVLLDSPIEANGGGDGGGGGGGGCGSAHQVTTASRSSSSQLLACHALSATSTFGLPPPPRAALLHASAYNSAALAAAALAELAAEKHCCDAIYEAEGLRRLVALLSAKEAPVAAEAAHALRSVAFRSAVDRDTIREKGGIPPLVELLRCGAHTPQAAWAAGALRHLGYADCHRWLALHARAHHSAPTPRVHERGR